MHTLQGSQSNVELDRPAERDPAQHRTLEAEMVEHRDDVVVRRVWSRRHGGVPVAAHVEARHTVPARQVRPDVVPHPAVADPCVHEDEEEAVPVDVVGEARRPRRARRDSITEGCSRACASGPARAS